MSQQLDRKIAKLVSVPLSNETLEALKDLGEIYPQNTQQARRALNGDLERRRLNLYKNVVSSFKQVDASLCDLASDVKQMENACQEMQSKLHQTYGASGGLLAQAEALREKR
jgi:hypothetical protein